jgi:hypothetical protein
MKLVTERVTTFKITSEWKKIFLKKLAYSESPIEF